MGSSPFLWQAINLSISRCGGGVTLIQGSELFLYEEHVFLRIVLLSLSLLLLLVLELSDLFWMKT